MQVGIFEFVKRRFFILWFSEPTTMSGIEQSSVKYCSPNLILVQIIECYHYRVIPLFAFFLTSLNFVFEMSHNSILILKSREIWVSFEWTDFQNFLQSVTGLNYLRVSISSSVHHGWLRQLFRFLRFLLFSFDLFNSFISISLWLYTWFLPGNHSDTKSGIFSVSPIYKC